MDAHLKLISKPEAIGSICDFTYKWCLNVGLSRAESARFTVAVDELVTNIILFGYPEESGEIQIEFNHTLSFIEVVVHELGEPFDLDRHNYDPKRALEEDNFEGAGFELIRHFTDDFTFLNLGREGKEFRLSRQIREKHIKEMFPELQKDRGEDGEQEPEPDYSVIPITPEDAEDISRLIYRTYDYTYVKDELYFPKKVERALQHNEKMGVVTRTGDGLAVGYFAVLKKPDTSIGEVGEAVVSPPHRRRGIMSRMLHALIDIAEKQGMMGLFGKAVTLHDISQRVNYKYGFRSTALILSESESIRYKGLSEDYPQPISIILDFLPIYESRKATVFLPDEYRELLLDIFEQIGTTVIEPEVDGRPESGEFSSIDVEIDYKDNTALLLVREFGDDFKQALTEVVEGLEQKEVNAIYADLPLEKPEVLTHYELFKKMGFIFSGLMPLFHRSRDYLRFQYTGRQLDFSLIETYSDMAKRITSVVKKEYDENSIRS